MENNNVDGMSSQDVLRQLFKTNNPKELFEEVYNKSFDKDKERSIESFCGSFNDDDSYNPPKDNELFGLQSLNTSKTNRTYTQNVTEQAQVYPEYNSPAMPNKNMEMMKNLLGESYVNNLMKKPISSEGSILGNVVNTVSPNVPNKSAQIFENYEVVEDQPKQISLSIEGKSYSGKISQNKKGQIFFLVGNNQAFILTPSTLKKVTKK